MLNTRTGSVAVLSADEMERWRAFCDESERRAASAAPVPPRSMDDDAPVPEEGLFELPETLDASTVALMRGLASLGFLVNDSHFEREQALFRYTEAQYQNNVLWLGVTDASSAGATALSTELVDAIAAFVEEQASEQALKSMRLAYPAAAAPQFAASLEALEERLACVCEGLGLAYVSSASALRSDADEVSAHDDFSCAQGLSPRPLHCAAVANRSFVIDCDGYAYKCPVDAGDPDKSAFSLFESPDLRTMRWDNVIRYVGFNPSGDEECRDCDVLPICRGGCPRQRLEGERPCVAIRGRIVDAARALVAESEETREGMGA